MQLTLTALEQLALRHIGDLPTIEAAIAAEVSATTAVGHVNASKAIADSLLPLATDWDSLSAAQKAEMSLAKMAAPAPGSRIAALLALLAQYGPLLIQILGGLVKPAA